MHVITTTDKKNNKVFSVLLSNNIKIFWELLSNNTENVYCATNMSHSKHFQIVTTNTADYFHTNFTKQSRRL